MKVAVSVHGRFHAFYLAAGLHSRGFLARLLTTYPRSVARRFLPGDLPLTTAPWIEAGRRLSEWTGVGGGVPLWVARRFAGFAARSMPDGIDIFVGWSGASLEAIRLAKSRGVAAIVERGSTHILHQRKVLKEAGDRWGVPVALPEPAMVEREVAEYEMADAIMVPTRLAAETFAAHGVPGEKVLVNPYGIDLQGAPFQERRGGAGPVRILFVGSVGARKGVPLLIEALPRLPENCEIHLVGPMENGLEKIVRRASPGRVIVHGPLRGVALGQVFHEADIFCLPSVEEGLALVLLQAMAAGLPVVATPATGAGMIGAEREGVLLVPLDDSDALAQALDGLVKNPDRRIDLGANARRRVEEYFTTEKYIDRAVSAYRALRSRLGAA